MTKLIIKLTRKKTIKSLFGIIIGLFSITGTIIAVLFYIYAKEDRCMRAYALTREAFDIIGNEKNTMWVKSQYKILNKEDLRKVYIANQKIDQALEICPNYFSYEIKGIILSRAGNLEDAILEFKKSIKMNPNYCWSYSDLAGVYAKLKRYDEAEYNYKMAVQTGPKNPHMYRNYGLFLYQDLKKIAEAKQAFEKSKVLMKDWGLELTFPRL